MNPSPEIHKLTGFIMPVGNGAVGKTSVARVLNMISQGKAIDEEELRKIRKTNNLEFEFITTRQSFGTDQYAITLQFLVPPGQKQSEGDSTGRSFERIISIYKDMIRTLDVVLFTYDLANHETFHDLAYWVDGIGKLMNDSTHFILLGTHLDQADYTEITKDEINQGMEYLRKEFQIIHPTWRGNCATLEVSCMSGANLDLLLKFLAGSVISAHKIKSEPI